MNPKDGLHLVPLPGAIPIQTLPDMRVVGAQINKRIARPSRFHVRIQDGVLFTQGPHGKQGIDRLVDDDSHANMVEQVVSHILLFLQELELTFRMMY